MTAAPLALRVHVPVACFRRPYARDFASSYPIAPPSTVYGMLLSMVGEEHRAAHIGAQLAVGRLRESSASRVLRTFYRWKEKDITHPKNRTPDHQELLTDVRIVVWVREGEGEGSERTLRARLEHALTCPEEIVRFGALCLGESTHLVDGVWRFGARPLKTDEQIEALIPDKGGELTMPIWADHIGSAGTRWGRYDFEEVEPDWSPLESGWTTIQPPG